MQENVRTTDSKIREEENVIGVNKHRYWMEMVEELVG